MFYIYLQEEEVLGILGILPKIDDNEKKIMACEYVKNLTKICTFERMCVNKKARGLGIAKKLIEKIK